MFRRRIDAAHAIVALTTLLAMAGCGADQFAPTAPNTFSGPFRTSADVSSDDASAGALGRAITMVPSETQFKAEEVHPTGIRLPEGIPVRIVASGEIRRKATASFVEACVRLAPFCETTPEVQEMANTGLPPWGDETWFGDRRGFAQLWWNGPADADGNTIVFAQDEPVIRMTWPGGELWAGHSYWECYWYITNPDYTHDEGDCWDMSGSWTIGVFPDDGSETDPKTGQPIGGTAKLFATLESTVDGAGFHLKAVATAAEEGRTLRDQHWVYVADVPPPLMTTAPQPLAAQRTSQGATQTSDHQAESTLPYLRRMSGLAPARAAGANFPQSAVATAASTSEQFLAGCDGLSECVAEAPAEPGKLVVTAVIDGVKYSAYANVGNGGAKLECPDRVVRVESATCRVTRPTGPVPVVTAWEFRPDSEALGIVQGLTEGGPTTWEGPMVASGTVAATVKVGAASQTLTHHITVDPRQGWPKDTIQWMWVEVSPMGLPSEPHQFNGELGKTTWKWDADRDAIRAVPNGPNAGIGYLAKPPARLAFAGSVNTEALSRGSSFYNAQADGNGGSTIRFSGVQPCVKSMFTKYVNAIWLHEGDQSRQPDSHVDTVLREWMRLVTEEGEGWIGTLDIERLERWNSSAATFSVQVTDGPERNPLNRTVLAKCVFNYTY